MPKTAGWSWWPSKMMKLKSILFVLFGATLLLPQWLLAQSAYMTEKQGTYSFRNTLKSNGTDHVSFGNHVKILSDFFHETIPVMKSNKGFDLAATLFGQWDDEYKTLFCNYGLRGELRFDFQLFLKDVNGKEGKWTVEPPAWALDINNTQTGHGGNLKEGNQGSLLKELFMVFPRVKQMAPGVDYYNCENQTCGSLVIFNPDRPPYWLPITVRQVVEAELKFYSTGEENKMLYDFIKPLVDKMSENELNAPAHYGSDDAILNVNGKREGLQIMRFNPDYWDRALPPSAVQFITIGGYGEYGLGNTNAEDQKNAEAEFLRNNGHPNYADLVKKSLILEKLPQLIQKK